MEFFLVAVASVDQAWGDRVRKVSPDVGPQVRGGTRWEGRGRGGRGGRLGGGGEGRGSEEKAGGGQASRPQEGDFHASLSPRWGTDARSFDGTS